MSNKNIFSSVKSAVSSLGSKATDTVNNAGGTAYALSDKAALAQLAMTGCFNGTYYVTAEDQLKKVLALADKVSPEYLAKLAVYSRQEGLMKDMPAVLAAIIANKDSSLLAKIFPKVLSDPKMIRNFVQIIRSGVTGRKSLGTRPKKLIQAYLESLTDEQLFRADVGNDPSLQDIIKLVHPRPAGAARSAMYGYLLGKEYKKEDLCELATHFEAFKKDMSVDIPNVPFQMLTALPLTEGHWKRIAKNATWNQTRMNLNTFARHGVFNDPEMESLVAERLSDKEQIARSKVFPYQLFSAFMNTDDKVPSSIKLALQNAADHALANIPSFSDKKVYVMVDTSGSMSSPVTGYRGTATSKIRCIDAAALIASAIIRKNEKAEVVPFNSRVVPYKLDPIASVMPNAAALSRIGGGGTDCSAAMKHLLDTNAEGDLVIYVSDNESWIDSGRYRNTATLAYWDKFKLRNKNAKLVCIDLTPNTTTQAHDRDDILNVGSFSDACFDVIAKFMEMGNNKDLWIKTIESVNLS